MPESMAKAASVRILPAWDHCAAVRASRPYLASLPLSRDLEIVMALTGSPAGAAARVKPNEVSSARCTCSRRAVRIGTGYFCIEWCWLCVAVVRRVSSVRRRSVISRALSCPAAFSRSRGSSRIARRCRLRRPG